MPKTIPINKAGFYLKVDWNKAPEVSREHAIDYGLRQMFNDSISGVKATDFKNRDEFVAECRKTVENKLAAFMAGELRAGGGGRTTDPVAREVKRLLVDTLGKHGVKVAEARKYTIREWAEEFFADSVEEAIAALESTARENVKRDAGFLDKLPKPKIAAKPDAE